MQLLESVLGRASGMDYQNEIAADYTRTGQEANASLQKAQHGSSADLLDYRGTFLLCSRSDRSCNRFPDLLYHMRSAYKAEMDLRLILLQ